MNIKNFVKKYVKDHPELIKDQAKTKTDWMRCYNDKKRPNIKCDICGQEKKYMTDVIDTPIYQSYCNHNKIEDDYDKKYVEVTCDKRFKIWGFTEADIRNILKHFDIYGVKTIEELIDKVKSMEQIQKPSVNKHNKIKDWEVEFEKFINKKVDLIFTGKLKVLCSRQALVNFISKTRQDAVEEYKRLNK